MTDLKTLKTILFEKKEKHEEHPERKKEREAYHQGYTALHAHAKKLGLHKDIIGQMEHHMKMYAKPPKPVKSSPSDSMYMDPGRTGAFRFGPRGPQG